MSAWQFCAGAGILLCALEMISGAFLFLPLGIAFLITAALSVLLGDSWSVAALWVCLGLSASFLYLVFHRWGRRLRKASGGDFRSGVEGMIGKRVVVMDWGGELGPNSGYVKLYADEWRAVAVPALVGLKKGDSVIIERVEGNTVFVKSVGKSVEEENVHV